MADMIYKALVAYSRTQSAALPHGMDLEGYEVWIPEDEGYLPDTDYAINHNSFVAILAVSTLCLCEKPEFKPSICTNSIGSRLLRRNTRPGKYLVKFFFENTSAVIDVNPSAKLSEVLVVLWRKFFILEELTPDMFEFRMFIEEVGNECALDMGLMIKELPKTDIRLYRKIHADTPQGKPQGMLHRLHKSQVILRSQFKC